MTLSMENRLLWLAMGVLLWLQVCLAAETCGHLQFNIKGDVWYSSEPFHCGDLPSGSVTYWELLRKVRWQSAYDDRMPSWWQIDIAVEVHCATLSVMTCQGC